MPLYNSAPVAAIGRAVQVPKSPPTIMVYLHPNLIWTLRVLRRKLLLTEPAAPRFTHDELKKHFPDSYRSMKNDFEARRAQLQQPGEQQAQAGGAAVERAALNRLAREACRSLYLGQLLVLQALLPLRPISNLTKLGT